MDTDKLVAPTLFVYWFGLQNLSHHTCCRAIKTTIIGAALIAYQSLWLWIRGLGLVLKISGLIKSTIKICIFDFFSTEDTHQIPLWMEKITSALKLLQFENCHICATKYFLPNLRLCQWPKTIRKTIFFLATIYPIPLGYFTWALKKAQMQNLTLFIEASNANPLLGAASLNGAFLNSSVLALI